ncbi:MAG: protein kinase, partial [Bryobacteraceae bacterium]
SDEQFTERFAYEARTVAALNHPNICTLHDVGPNYLVMELVEGETLVERIKQGPMPLDEALAIVCQVADALEAAHSKGIVHRDLKPGNIKIKSDGTVKVLDFGLAKMAEGVVASSSDPSMSPTLTLEAATHVGAILGTASYMSPEQAKGRAVDKRADIWAFGVVLYEMLTGSRLFDGETVSDTLASVLKDEPDFDSVPLRVRRLLQACLKKDPKQRLHDIADAKLLLDETPPMARRPRQWLPWAGMALFCLIAVGLASLLFRETPPPAQLVRFQVPAPGRSTWIYQGFFGALSPDGRQLAFVAIGPDGISRLSVRPLDSLMSRPVAGTEGIQGIPIWSPDGRFLVFSAGGKFKKVGISGGPAQNLCNVLGRVVGGFWTKDDRIVFGSNSGLRYVAAAGGTLSVITNVDKKHGEGAHICPFLLPDGRHFLYLVTSADPDRGGIYVGSLDGKPEAQNAKRLLADSSTAQFVPSPGSRSGHLLFVRETTLMAQPFDPERLVLSGNSVPITGTGVRSVFSASANGVLAYLEAGSLETTLTWFDRQGKAIGTAAGPHSFQELALSPDGSRVVVFRRDNTGEDLWLIELERGSSTRLTIDAANESYPVWSPDGKQIVFASNRGGQFDLYRKSANVSGEEELLLKSPQAKDPVDWSRDGRFILYTLTTGAQTDLWVLPLDGERKPVPYLTTKFNEGYGRFSPDGRWVAYVSNVSGNDEVYVSPFPSSTAANAMTMVSSGGGRQPRWRRDGRELYYISFDDQLMGAPVTTSPSFKAGVAKPLFQAPIYLTMDTAGAWNWDVTPDGERFLINRKPVDIVSSAAITVVLNWQEVLKK